MRTPSLAVAVACLACQIAVAADMAPEEPRRVKPMRGVQMAAQLVEGAAGPQFPSIAIELDEAAWAEMERGDVAWLDAVPLSDGSTVDLRLSRVEAFTPDARIVVVEAAPGGGTIEREIPRPQLSAWAGEVSGWPGSRAFIARSDAGLQGWIQFQGHTEILSSGEAGAGRVPLMSNAALIGITAPVCEAPPPMDEGDVLEEMPPMAYFAAAACRQLPVAVDTDQELLAKFSGNTTSASAYVATLFAGMGDIYSRDFNVRPSICYLRWWTTTDPWTATSGTSAQLTEFRTYWNTNMRTTPRSLATLLSARGLGGGVAWLSQVCASTSGSGYGYSVSADLNGTFPYPLASQNSGNWDIIVTSHEIGHNMSAQHTHDLGVDDCYTSSGLGACTQRLQGTVMSYCHLCSGGVANINLVFDAVNIPSVISHVGSKSCTSPTTALPAGLADTYTVMEGSSNTLDILANDLPANCESVTIQGLPAASTKGVSLSINPTGSPSGGPAITYNPAAGVRGTDTFTYQLRDASNQVSSTITVSIDVKPVLQAFTGLAGNEPGFNARYYNLTSPTTLPNFSALTPFSYGSVPSLVFSSGSGACVGSGVADNVGAVFEGWILAPSEGNYVMGLTSDAGSQLYLDGELIIDHNGIHVYSEKTNTVYLKAGYHSVRIPFFEATGNCGLQLKWAPPGTTTRVLVPGSAISRGGQIFDLDGSGGVDAGDISYLLLSLGGECPGRRCYGDANGQQVIGIDPNCSCPEDLDGSGEVDAGDIAYLLLY
ncbi:MAG: M12 family metallo-peptidase [Phycisphaerales bacterium]